MESGCQEMKASAMRWESGAPPPSPLPCREGEPDGSMWLVGAGFRAADSWLINDSPSSGSANFFMQ
ncbi:hypothetical protein GCM10023185_13620 [Hymenobacter saemangeumensis]|uniref:Uncharacterized protein n=1 Tax=Hymenobacter saemangeumensis TaxID=1084522 RepID=A0ABP8I7U2_9BACT